MTEEAALAIPLETPGSDEGGTRNPFAVARYRRWWLASVLAGTGVGIQAVTVPLFIRDRVAEDDRAIAIAAALICLNLPAAIFALVGGVVADRTERRRILVRTYAVAAVVSMAYVVLSGMDVSVIWPVFPLAAVVGAAGAFTNPARQSMMPQILDRAQLQNGVILGTMAFMATLQFGGPTLGGLLADGPGLTLAFGAEVVLLLLAALLFGSIATDQPIPSGRSVRSDMVEGLRYIRGRPDLLGVLLLGTVPGVFIMGPFAVNIVIIVSDVFDASDKFVGLFWGCFGGGIVLGSALMTVVRLPKRGMSLCLSLVFGGALVAAFGASDVLWLSMALLFVSGIVGPAVFINYAVALLQEHAAPQMLGRVMSMYGLSFMASSPVGYLQGGIVSSMFGPQVAVAGSGLVACALGVLCVLFLRPVRTLE